MKRFTALFLTLFLAVVSLTACVKYSSHCSAVAYVYSNDQDSASVSFYKLEGTEVFKLKIKNGETAKIHYSGKLETGSATVYYDSEKKKTELFSIRSGEEINACSDDLPAGKVYVIIETSGECQSGSFSFEIVEN